MVACRRVWIGTTAACLAVFVMGPSLIGSGRAVPQGEPRFIFRNGFWTNVHHALLADAARRQQQQALALPLDGLSGGEVQAWSAVLDAYDAFKGRSVIFDDEGRVGRRRGRADWRFDEALAVRLRDQS